MYIELVSYVLHILDSRQWNSPGVKRALFNVGAYEENYHIYNGKRNFLKYYKPVHRQFYKDFALELRFAFEDAEKEENDDMEVIYTIMMSIGIEMDNNGDFFLNLPKEKGPAYYGDLPTIYWLR